ncbi:hypothetical protein M8J76_012433 [Diaphorina citri]|nr:hypothetical protein M8J76_012433 [Diaphorina citri]
MTSAASFLSDLFSMEEIAIEQDLTWTDCLYLGILFTTILLLVTCTNIMYCKCQSNLSTQITPTLATDLLQTNFRALVPHFLTRQAAAEQFPRSMSITGSLPSVNAAYRGPLRSRTLGSSAFHGFPAYSSHRIDHWLDCDTQHHTDDSDGEGSYHSYRSHGIGVACGIADADGIGATPTSSYHSLRSLIADDDVDSNYHSLRSQLASGDDFDSNNHRLRSENVAEDDFDGGPTSSVHSSARPHDEDIIRPQSQGNISYTLPSEELDNAFSNFSEIRLRDTNGEFPNQLNED